MFHYTYEPTVEEVGSFEFDDAKVRIVDTKFISNELWEVIFKEFRLLGYGWDDWKSMRDFYEERIASVGKIEFIPDQGDVVRKIIRKEVIRNFYIPEEQRAAIQKAALEKYGTTSDFSLAGYITPDGECLNFGLFGSRDVDHRDVRDILPVDSYDYSAPLIYFENMGNIRVKSAGIELSVLPTSAQEQVLRDLVDYHNGRLYVDISLDNGHIAGFMEYTEGTCSSRVLSDIRKVFEERVIPEGTAH